ncbi:MAG: hypothetical protein QME79_13195 [Bacillota bacterium]|nr:hypothetical protein [Bacillota bacterium]
MRDAIREKLIAAVPEVGGRVVEPGVPGRETPKPYLVVRQGVDAEDTPWTGFRRIVEIWPYFSRQTFKDVDSLAAKIITALADQPLTTAAGEVFTCQYLGAAGSDVVDTEWDAITRGLRFAVLALQPVAASETVANDPWVEAVALWTEELLGATWTVYRNFWPLGYKRPAVMWRLAGPHQVRERARAVFEVRAKLVGHVIGATPNQQASGILQIVEGLGSAIKVVLDTANRRYLAVDEPTADYQADPLVAGQIGVVLSRLTNRPTEEAPLMQHIAANGVWR